MRDRNARRLKSTLRIAHAGAQLGDLAAAAGHRILVAEEARRRIEHRPEPVRDDLDVVERFLVFVESRLIGYAVGLVVEGRQRLLRAGTGYIGLGAEIGWHGRHDDAGKQDQ